MALKVVSGDITKIAADAIVNSANPKPICGGSTEALIYEAAGYDDLWDARQKIGALSVGQVGVTPAFKLNAKYIVHVSSPRWNDGRSGEAMALKMCYHNAIRAAYEQGCKSIAFPLLSSGAYHFPKKQALDIATESIEESLNQFAMEVLLVIYTKDSSAISATLSRKLDSFLQKNFEPEADLMYSFSGPLLEDKMPDQEEDFESFVKGLPKLSNGCKKESPSKKDENKKVKLNRPELAKTCPKTPYSILLSIGDSLSKTQAKPFSVSREAIDKSIREMLDEKRSMTFSERLCEIMYEKGLSSSMVQRDADIDRKLFSKIISNKSYNTTKTTAIALSIGLGLNYVEAKEFLALAGFALSPSSKSDLIVQFFMENKDAFYRENSDRNKYKVIYLNDILMNYGLETLGASRHVKALPSK